MASSSTNNNNRPEYITVQSVGFGNLRIGIEWARKSHLAKLFQLPINLLVVVNQQGEELSEEGGMYKDLQENQTYTVTSEEELDAMPDEDQGPREITQEEMQKLVERRSIRIHGMQNARTELIREFYKPLHPNIYNFSEVCT